MGKLQPGVNDLETWCKKNGREELLEEWDYEKNGDFSPASIYFGTSKKYWWIGKCSHSYQASPNQRTSNKTGCPYCCSSHAKLLVGFNDLATTNPELLRYWDYERNGDLLPSMVMKGQHIKVWWIGDCGHKWESTIYHRVNGRGCPICKKENQTSFPEQALFYYIRLVFSDAISADRKVLNGKELDIYIPSIKFAIEFDGSKWHDEIDKDIAKNELCKKKDITLIRVRDIYIIQKSGINFFLPHIWDFE